MNWRTGLRKGRSHILLALALILAGALLIHLDDEQLAKGLAHRCDVSEAGAHCPQPGRLQPGRVRP